MRPYLAPRQDKGWTSVCGGSWFCDQEQQENRTIDQWNQGKNNILTNDSPLTWLHIKTEAGDLSVEVAGVVDAG